ncbi:MAG TPA: alginate lyase family protein [Terriglobales bacterium]|nr:alginate lyase family protein [Terriglobales bacterium]
MSAVAQQHPPIIEAEIFNLDVSRFLGQQLTAHVADITTLDPPPDRVMGALTMGEFSWGAFARALGSYYALTGERKLAGRDLAEFIGKIGLIEARKGGKTFAQLYGAIALSSFGANLSSNAVWQSLTPEEQQAWRSLLDPSRFYDRNTRRVINLPENYFGVAARIVALDQKLGVLNDKAFVDDVIDRAAEQFVSGNLYSDDGLPAGRFDRYSNEYARYVYMAAELAGRKDVMKALEPTLKRQMQTWWDLISPDGYGYPWGRSLGAISYMDTMEIVAFLGEHPQFRPAPMSQLASAYYTAWQWLKHDVLPERHVLNVFGYGRGNYSYINREREWQQTSAFLGKVAGAQYSFQRAMKAEQLATISTQVVLPNVARFEYFRRGDREFGVWLVRQPGIQFALPITSGTKPGTSDYLPSPYNLLNFVPPVEQILPVMTPFIQLSDGRTIVASDGADEIQPGADGKSLRAVWRRWAVIGTKAGELTAPGIVADVRWELQGTSLVRKESLSVSKPIEIRRMWMVVSSSAEHCVRVGNGETYNFAGPEGEMTFAFTGWGQNTSREIRFTGDSPLGKGSRGAVPVLLEIEREDFELSPQEPLSWAMTMTVAPRQARVAVQHPKSPRVFLMDANALNEARAHSQSSGAKDQLTLKVTRDGDRALSAGQFSVMQKQVVPPSGDKHDYMSQGPYWWPDSAKPDGLPYIRRDGERNPEIYKIGDNEQMDKMVSSVRALALAWWLTGSQKYADRATLLLRTFFLDPATRMNPNLNFAQGIPGRYRGGKSGIIESRNLTMVVDAVGLLQDSHAWTAADQAGMERWLGDFLAWLRQNPLGIAESKSKNNHGTYYDVQVATFALFIGDSSLAKNVLHEAMQKRIATQVEPDGRQPLELLRTKAFSYSCMNLLGLTDLATLGELVGEDLWNFETEDGRSIRRAVDFLVPYADGSKKWDYPQITEMKLGDFAPSLWRAAVAYKNSRYSKLAHQIEPTSNSGLMLLRLSANVAGM